jgi:hypothetical protein
VDDVDRVVLVVLPDRPGQLPSALALFGIGRREPFELPKSPRVELLARLLPRLEKARLPGDHEPSQPALEFADEPFEPQRGRRDVFRVRFSARRIVEAGDCVDQDGEDARD